MSEGQEVQVKVLDVERGRIKLSIKELLEGEEKKDVDEEAIEDSDD